MDSSVFFETRIRPLLSQECFECHSERSPKVKGGLKLDSRSALLKGGDSGPAIQPGNPDESLMIRAVRYRDEQTAMPPKKKLSSTQVAALETWVKLGSPWPDAPPVTGLRKSTDTSVDPTTLRTTHWAFQPIRRPALPESHGSFPNQNAIDLFVSARLKLAGLKANPPADRRALVRRASLDLIGLPPSPAEVDSFLQDDRPDAFARVVDRLLASPHYGERWGRHWLDIARYSDGLGGFLDGESLPEAWRFRDWVVEALNRDLPYNRFLYEQIAGGLGSTNSVGNTATGFFAVGPTYISDGGDPEAEAQARAETLADRVDTLSRGFLGLTVACARCHDHKFDPISTRDYYALAGIFNNTKKQLLPLAPAETVAQYDSAQKQLRALEQRLKEADTLFQQITANQTNQSTRSATASTDSTHTPAAAKQRFELVRSELEQHRASLPAIYPRAHVLAETGTNDMPVAIRGDLRKPGEVVPRRFIEVLTVTPPPTFRNGSGLRELAEALIAPSNPLTARVLVNRVWKHHFGQALVRTPSNFGLLGEKPTHPELLDWLAVEFMENGWSLKRLHRQILLSATWQQSSRHQESAHAQDGENRLLWRMNPRKLEVEAWRDSLLGVTSELDQTLFGPPTDRILEIPRRTLYATISRNGDRFLSDELFRLFDFPAPRTSSESRSVSTVPQQYLFLLNSQFMSDRSKALARFLLRMAPENTERIQFAYQRLYSRPATQEEIQLGLHFLKAPGNDSDEGWQKYAQVLLSAHEFMQIP